MSSGDVLHVEDIIYVPGLNKNVLSVSFLEYKGFQVIFKENKAYLWPKNQNIDIVVVIGF